MAGFGFDRSWCCRRRWGRRGCGVSGRFVEPLEPRPLPPPSEAKKLFDRKYSARHFIGRAGNCGGALARRGTGSTEVRKTCVLEIDRRAERWKRQRMQIEGGGRGGINIASGAGEWLDGPNWLVGGGAGESEDEVEKV